MFVFARQTYLELVAGGAATAATAIAGATIAALPPSDVGSEEDPVIGTTEPV